MTVRFMHLIVLVFLSGCLTSVSAQDVLTLKSGKTLQVQIVDESGGIVKYRDAGNTSGPLYSVSRENVATIKYGRKSKSNTEEKVSKDNEVAVNKSEPVEESQLLTVKKRYVYLNKRVQSPRQVKTIMEDYPAAVDMYTSGRKLLSASNVCPVSVVGICFAANLITNGMEDNSDRLKVLGPALAISGGLMISGIILASQGKKKVRKAVNIYNEGISKPVSYEIKFGISGQGIGLALRF